jgi:hypothetical protein
MMIVASTVHRSPPQRLASPAQVQRMRRRAKHSMRFGKKMFNVILND